MFSKLNQIQHNIIGLTNIHNKGVSLRVGCKAEWFYLSK